MGLSGAPLRRSPALMCLMLYSALAGAAEDPCLAFKWDLARERALFSSPVTSAVDANTSPPAVIDPETAVNLALRPQDSVRFLAPPAKPMLTDGAFAGVASFRVATPGIYRIALGAPFWVDVLADGEALTSVDFGGPGSQCPPPIKVVTYDLPAGRLLTLQLSGATERRVRLTITKVP